MPKTKKIKKKIKSKQDGKVKKEAKKPKKIEAKKSIEKPLETPPRYWEAVGRRKTAIARVRLFTKGEKEILINERPYQKYFPDIELWKIVTSPLEKMRSLGRFRVLAKIKGGGIHSQAEAVRHGIARALVKFNVDFRKRLKKAGFLTRDSRMRERKKFGLKRARRAPQWQKR